MFTLKQRTLVSCPCSTNEHFGVLAYT